MNLTFISCLWLFIKLLNVEWKNFQPVFNRNFELIFYINQNNVQGTRENLKSKNQNQLSSSDWTSGKFNDFLQKNDNNKKLSSLSKKWNKNIVMIFGEGQVAVNVNRQSKISDMKNILLSAICFVKVYGSKIIEINLKKIVNYLKMRRAHKKMCI